MGNFLILTGLVVVAVFIPVAVILGVWADLFPDAIAVSIAEISSMVGVALAIIYIVGGNLYLMYGDIKTGRYSNK